MQYSVSSFVTTQEFKFGTECVSEFVVIIIITYLFSLFVCEQLKLTIYFSLLRSSNVLKYLVNRNDH